MSSVISGTVEDLVHQYDDAWNAHDIDSILALHTPDMIFHLHLPGFQEVSGDQELREHFRQFFGLWPDLEFRSFRLNVADGLVTNEILMSGTLAGPMAVGDLTLVPNGQKATFESVDVLVVENGRIKRKDTYLDSASLLTQVQQPRA